MPTKFFGHFRRTMTARLPCRPAGLIGQPINLNCSPSGIKTVTGLKADHADKISLNLKLETN